MRLKFEQLNRHLESGLAPIYLLSGDEPLQRQEAADAIRTRARTDGVAERQVMSVDRGFDWGTLLQAADSLSLFSERRLIELRMSGKPGDGGAQALCAYAERVPDDTVLLVTCGKLDKTTVSRAKWVRALEQSGVLMQFWPIELGALPDWIRRRMNARGLQPSREAVAMLADRVEGNLLAAAQEIDKLLLLRGPGRIDVNEVAAAVADSARFDVFGLVDQALAGRAGRTVRVLNGLRNEGVAPLLVCWALTREVRALTAMAGELQRGARPEAVLAAHKVWERRRPLIGGALKRRRPAAWYRLLARCDRAEQVIKGAAVGNAWDELIQLGLMLAGTPVFQAAG